MMLHMADATEKFRAIATAYDVLKGEDTRREYEDMLDHPERYYQHYARYMRFKYARKSNVWYGVRLRFFFGCA